MALPLMAYPAYVLTSSVESGTAQITLAIGRDAELIGQEGADVLAAQLSASLGELTGASVHTTKVTVTETAI
ncbi:hypothetical protein [Streptomyces sp. NPDC088736]|uniref:hypothetical protein n=1 Tax=Streptomyces sp. NPDC088736 TaxID=3365881 RepID=UPI00382E8F59